MEVTVASILTSIEDVFEGIIGMVGEVASTITGNPLLFVGVLVGFSGLAIGMFKRLFSR